MIIKFFQYVIDITQHIRRYKFNLCPNINIGTGTKIYSDVKFKRVKGGSIKIGKNCEIYDGVIFLPYGGGIVIGDNCSFNHYCVIHGHGGLTIGNGVRIASHTVVIPANHNYNDRHRYIYKQGETYKGIIIEDDVWIGTNCVILDGITISQGCVIGAGSVVARSTEPNGIYGGVPANLLKYRGKDDRKTT
jgi:acetyltransferase-like isoleucine patch superfamily enzyme